MSFGNISSIGAIGRTLNLTAEQKAALLRPEQHKALEKIKDSSFVEIAAPSSATWRICCGSQSLTPAA
jgi:hypothetical protein